MTLEQRKQVVTKNLYNLLTKYWKYNYALLWYTQFKNDHNIPYNAPIDIEDIKKIYPFYQIDDQSRIFFPNNTWGYDIKYIKKLQYFVIDNENLENLLEQIHYNISWYMLLKWYTTPQNYEYRLAYWLEFFDK
jgi:hypothetical protein